MNPGFWLLILLTFWSTAAYASDARELREDEARALAQVAVPSMTARLPGLHFDASKDPYYPDFYFFEALWNSTGDISPIAGHYAVDSRTGDVWNIITCGELKSPTLSWRQAALRKKMGLAPKQYIKIRRLRPMCE